MDIHITKNVAIPMRDGISLIADIYRSLDEQPAPVVLMRVPYNKEMVVTLSDVTRYVTAGYVVLAQDTRGRFASGGDFNPFGDELADGEDTIRWIAQQQFCDGSVAMAGASYFGATQWLAAAGDSPQLKAIAPSITASSYYEGWTYQGGAFELGFMLSWTLGVLALGDVGKAIGAGRVPPETFSQLVGALDGISDVFWRTPLTDLPVLNDLAPYYFDWLAHPTDDEFWRASAPRERYDRVQAASLNIGGWYDCFLGGTLANYAGVKAGGTSAAARVPRLVIGPWSHGMMLGEFPTGSFGLMANSLVADLTGRQLKFFDHHVRGIDNGLDTEPPVSIFVMGANVWREEADWPLPDTKYTPYFLHSEGNASTNGGTLSTTSADAEPADVIVYDPHDPAPTIGGQTFLPGFQIGANAGPRDRRELEARPDVLCFSTPALAADIEVTGPVSLILHVESNARDTDFTAGLVDVHPDGRAVILTEGILRARYRNSTREPELLIPGQPYELMIDMWATSNVFKAGHRIRLEVSSSNFPRFDRNSNTGAPAIAAELAADYVVARNTVHHDRDRPTRLILPVIDRA